jgi:cell division protein FtsB
MIFIKKNFFLFLFITMTIVFFYYTINIFYGEYSFSEIRKLKKDLKDLKSSNEKINKENKILFEKYSNINDNKSD